MVKLLLPYRPEAPLAAAQEAVAKQVIADSQSAGIPLVLEPLPWGLDTPNDHAELIVTIIERFAALEPALLKVPFPGKGLADLSVSRRACAAINERCTMPWAVLSGGGTFESFEEQLTMAVSAGCSGYMVGRALWGEAATASPADRPLLLKELVRPRLARLNRVVASRG
jgi:tagatose-1,6-bisphosphate aldolase